MYSIITLLWTKKNRCSSLLILALHHDVVGILNGSNFEVPTRENGEFMTWHTFLEERLVLIHPRKNFS